jgi:hypothetical protein
MDKYIDIRIFLILMICFQAAIIVIIINYQMSLCEMMEEIQQLMTQLIHYIKY